MSGPSIKEGGDPHHKQVVKFSIGKETIITLQPLQGQTQSVLHCFPKGQNIYSVYLIVHDDFLWKCFFFKLL